MITVEIGDVRAIFNGTRWITPDKVWRSLLNTLTDFDLMGPGDAYAPSSYNSTVRGIDGFALDAISFLEPILVKMELLPVPEEQEGVLI